MGFIGTFVGIGTAVAAIKGLADWFERDIRQDAIDAVKETINFREQLMELAAMKNELGRTGPELGRQLLLQSQTAQDPGDLLKMSKTAEGAAQATIGKNIARQAYDQGFIAAGKLQAMEGPGSRSATGNRNARAQGQARNDRRPDASQIWREFKISQPGKFASMGEYAKRRQALSAYVQTGSLTGNQLSGMLSAISLAAPPGEAATVHNQGITRPHHRVNAHPRDEINARHGARDYADMSRNTLALT